MFFHLFLNILLNAPPTQGSTLHVLSPASKKKKKKGKSKQNNGCTVIYVNYVWLNFAWRLHIFYREVVVGGLFVFVKRTCDYLLVQILVKKNLCIIVTVPHHREIGQVYFCLRFYIFVTWLIAVSFYIGCVSNLIFTFSTVLLLMSSIQSKQNWWTIINHARMTWDDSIRVIVFV